MICIKVIKTGVVKHTARGPEPAKQRVHSGPLVNFAKWENYRILKSNISTKHISVLAYFCSPFSVKSPDLSVDVKLEITALQRHSDFKDTFYQYLFPG